MFFDAIKETLAFGALIIGMVGIPGLILLYLDWRFRWGWWFKSSQKGGHMIKRRRIKRSWLLNIGKFYIGIRDCGRHEFKWFYHPLIKEHEEENFRFFVWFGWHFYITLTK